MKAQCGQVNEDSKFFGLYVSGTPHHRPCMWSSAVASDTAAAAMLATLGLGIGTTFPVSAQLLGAQSCDPGRASLLLLLPVGTSSV